MRNSFRFLLATATLCTVPLHADVYNLVKDFNPGPGGNPNGVWTYGKLTANTLSFSPLTFFDNSSNPDLVFWANAPWSSGYPNYYPLVAYNTTGADYSGLGTNNPLPGDMLYIAPGYSPDMVDVRFTAPAAKSYSFNGLFEFLNHGPTQWREDISVLQNLTPIIGPVDIQGPEPQYTVPVNLSDVSLQAGDTMDFVVYAGFNWGDANGFKMEVTEWTPSAVPEPSTLGLLALPTAWLLLRLRRR